MNLKLVIVVILILAVIGIAAWYVVALVSDSMGSPYNAPETTRDTTGRTPPITGANAAAGLETDFDKIPDDSSVENQMKILDQNVNYF